ncbi:MAG: von Willebrand factor type domain protein [Labilithrix sp.]|nr:von Willebrand factor type domain protein [Labilithrix sp.]
MRRYFRPLVTLLLLVIVHALASCAEPQVPALDVTPQVANLVTGKTVQLTVERRFAGGPAEHVTDRVIYTSSNSSIATVSNTGLVKAGAETGSVVIRVLDLGSDATATATLTVAAPRIETIDVVPSPALVMKPGASQKFTASARLNDGTVKDVTSQVIWASSDTNVAAVGVTPADLGLVTAIALGETTITATDSATLVRGRSLVFVRGEAAQLSAIVVTPNPSTILLGQTAQLSAQGVYADGSTKPILSSLTWSSSNNAVATIDASGLATAVAVGDTTITAATADGAVKGSAAVRVP